MADYRAITLCWTDGVNMPTIDNLYALSELLQVQIDAIVCGNRAPIVPDIIIRQPDSYESRLFAYCENKVNKNNI